MKELCVTEKNIRIPNLSKPFCIYHTADVHLTGMEDTQPEGRREDAKVRGRVLFSPEVPAEERLARHLQKAAERGANLVLLGGDIIDTPSEENLAALRRAIASSAVPVLYHVGNHDWSYADSYQCATYERDLYPAFSEFCTGESKDPAFQTKDYPDFRILALDNGRERFSDAVLSQTENALRDGKPTLIAMHIPLYADTLTEDTACVWHRDITLGGAHGIVKGENTAKFLSLIAGEDSPVCALLTGHLHFAHDDLVAGHLPQFVVGGGYEGMANLYRLTAE